jgi:hypothetical protein
MDPLADENEGLWENFSVCPSCLEAAKQCYRATRQKLWDDLPSIFDLGTWEDLLPGKCNNLSAYQRLTWFPSARTSFLNQSWNIPPYSDIDNFLRSHNFTVHICL